MSFDVQVANTVTQMREQGFAIIEGLISEERLRQAKQDADKFLEESPIQKQGPRGPVNPRMCKDLFRRTRAFDDLYSIPVVLSVVEEVLGGESNEHLREVWGGSIQFAYCMLKDVVPGEGPREFHQDDVLYPVPRPHKSIAVNTLLALDDFTEETGATLVVPKSHTWSEPVSQTPEYEVAEMPAGSLLLLDGAIWHNSGTNTTQAQYRRALNTYYSSRWLRPLGGPYLGLTTTELEDLSPELRAII
ncbi:MAG: phytanoyl-CoA dioxygenase family protein [Gammaproteobacteria bacterium]|nr:phytanoyl-CoA dioxygenase family protein [Gammaproteobacteria bacterium]